MGMIASRTEFGNWESGPGLRWQPFGIDNSGHCRIAQLSLVSLCIGKHRNSTQRRKDAKTQRRQVAKGEAMSRIPVFLASWRLGDLATWRLCVEFPLVRIGSCVETTGGLFVDRRASHHTLQSVCGESGESESAGSTGNRGMVCHSRYGNSASYAAHAVES